jgi:hypothetical protein
VIPYDSLPVEFRRANFGWFGEPWPSGVCYDDDGRLLEEMRKPFPAGERCPYCDELFQPGDSGTAMPFVGMAGTQIRHVHKECTFREVMGPLAHLERRCPCFGGESNQTPGLTARQEALEVWRRWVP